MGGSLDDHSILPNPLPFPEWEGPRDENYRPVGTTHNDRPVLDLPPIEDNPSDQPPQ